MIKRQKQSIVIVKEAVISWSWFLPLQSCILLSFCSYFTVICRFNKKILRSSGKWFFETPGSNADHPVHIFVFGRIEVWVFSGRTDLQRRCLTAGEVKSFVQSEWDRLTLHQRWNLSSSSPWHPLWSLHAARWWKINPGSNVCVWALFKSLNKNCAMLSAGSFFFLKTCSFCKICLLVRGVCMKSLQIFST